MYISTRKGGCSMKKLLFTYNPNSGKGAVKLALSDILATFTAGGYDVMVHPTCCPGDSLEFISQRGSEFDLIVSSGGDGMLHELVYGISAGKLTVPCGYIPSGTVNDFATSLNIPKDMRKAAEMITQENFLPVDIGRFNGGYFAYISAFGWFTDVSYVTSQKTKNRLGSFAYFLTGLRSFEPKYLKENSGRVNITWDHGVIEDDFIYCMAGNTHSVGGMKNIVPDGASLTDGKLDCLFVRTPRNLSDIDAINRFVMSHDCDTDMIVSFKTSSLSVTCEKPFRWTLDGENGGEYTSADISVVPGAVRIAVPRAE